jgi:hypothetical protein
MPSLIDPNEDIALVFMTQHAGFPGANHVMHFQDGAYLAICASQTKFHAPLKQ